MGDRAAGCALVLYARVPGQGDVKTRLGPALSPDERRAFHSALLEDAVALLRLVAGRVGATPLLSFSAERERGKASAGDDLEPMCRGLDRLPQRGGDLGSRLAGTLADLASSGSEKAVIFGSDSPTLPPEWLELACEAIVGGAQLVLGPAFDGGYYLIGSRLPAPPLFDGIAWGGDRVLQETLLRARRAGARPALLPPWYDVDRPDDMTRADRDVTRTGGHAPEATARFLRRLRAAGRIGGSARG